MLIVNSKYNEVYNFDRIAKLEIAYVGKVDDVEKYTLNACFENNDDNNVDMLAYCGTHKEAKTMLQDILDAYAKGTRVFYINGRII